MSEKYVVTWDMLQIHARTMAKRLLPAEQWKGIIAVSRGGLVPAALLARELCIRHVDTVCISSYDHDNQREMQVLKRAEGDGEGFIVIDDLVDTAGTLGKAADALKANGAVQVMAYVTHPVLSGKAVENIMNSSLDELVVTDTLPLRADAAACPRIRQLSISELLAETMRRISDEDSVSTLLMG